MSDGQVLHTSPYVVQIEKISESLKRLSQIFIGLEEKKKCFTNEEIDSIFEHVKEKVCKKCEKCDWCLNENIVHTCQMEYEILSAIDRYGNELNTETKRNLQAKCIRAPRFLRETLEAFHEARQNMMWTNRMVQSREGCAAQMNTFADMLRVTAKELEDSIFTDERMEKRIMDSLRKLGLRVLSINLLINKDGKYEIQVIARAMKKECVMMKEIIRAISETIGRKIVSDGTNNQIVGREYTTIVCMEGPVFYTLQGIAKIGKGCNRISGDNFTMMELPGGKQGVALSDGMGSGEIACRESTLVIELLEELLEAGFPEKMAIQMINATLVMGREEIRFSTVDLSVFDLYTGKCELIKAGASSTFIKKKDKVELLTSSSLPIGVLHTIELDSIVRQLEDGDFVIMVTDGIMDALPVGEQEIILETIIQGTNINNPKDLAHHILEQILNWNEKPPMDDMTVLVIGMWER